MHFHRDEEMKDNLMNNNQDTTKKDHAEVKKYKWTARSGTDRRSGIDRRQLHRLYRRANDQVEQRSYKERRESGELRSNWVRITSWSSIYITSSYLNS